MSNERDRKRSELAKEFAAQSEHSAAEIDRVLAAFLDPENPEMGLETFMKNLETMAVSGRDLNENDLAVLDALNSTVNDVKDARLFNDTYIGHMLSEASIPGMLGYFIGIRTGSNTVAREVSIFESELEPEAMKGLAEIVGYDPNKSDGTFASGGSEAMETALLMARTKMVDSGIKATHDKPYLVFGTPYTHYSVSKMVKIVGGPSNEIVKKDVGIKNFRMDEVSLEESLAKAKMDKQPVMAIVAIAGETETGVIDPIAKIMKLGEKYGVPVIVDGAYGAPYRISRNGKMLDGMEKAYAITIDPHKALNTPYSNGAVLFKDKGDLYLGYGDRSTYLGEGANLGQKRISGSMGAGPILSTVAVLRSMGKEGLATMYDLTLDRVEHLHQRVEESPYLENLYYPELNVMCFTLSALGAEMVGARTPKEIKKAIDRIRVELDKDIKKKGGYFFSSTELPMTDGFELPVFRAVLMNPRTTDKILDQAITEMEKIIIRGNK